MSLERSLSKRAGALGFAACLLLTSGPTWAASGEVGRTPACLHPNRAAEASHTSRDKSAAKAERIIVGLIGAGTTAWNATLGGIMPAPEIVLKKVGRA